MYEGRRFNFFIRYNLSPNPLLLVPQWIVFACDLIPFDVFLRSQHNCFLECVLNEDIRGGNPA